MMKLSEAENTCGILCSVQNFFIDAARRRSTLNFIIKGGPRGRTLSVGKSHAHNPAQNPTPNRPPNRPEPLVSYTKTQFRFFLPAGPGPPVARVARGKTIATDLKI